MATTQIPNFLLTGTYDVNDVVVFNGELYRARNALDGSSTALTQNPDVDTTNWELLSSDTGPIGPRGADGIQGPQGETGFAGAIGPKGDTGPQGPKGEDGDTGPVGPKGDQGDVGPAGPIGPKGDASNVPGPRGLVGPKGDTGERGPQGIQGLTGERGLVGPKGDTGERGADGAVGPRGADGIQGPQGETGFTGAVGPKGDTGPQGPKGEDGSDGGIGPRGEQGPRGLVGPRGDDGTHGHYNAFIFIRSESEPAHPGASNYNFESGSLAVPTGWSQDIPADDGNPVWMTFATFDPRNAIPGGNPNVVQVVWGDITRFTGQDGAIGPRGADGVAGPQGIQGERGVDGAVGPRGEQGLQGERGLVGPRGADGAQGAAGAFQKYIFIRTNSDIDGTTVTGSTYNINTGTYSNLPTGWSETSDGDLDLLLHAVIGNVDPNTADSSGNVSITWSQVFTVTGTQGMPGLPGAIGPRGPQGPVGATGAQGPAGTGATGPAGPAGPQGPAGVPLLTPINLNLETTTTELTLSNLPGAKGDQGEQGPAGPQGPQGPQGERGDQGIQGERGLQGDQGDQGLQGIQGEKGDTGDQGPQGLTGRQGPRGLQGDQGERGDQGIQGERGPRGEQGPAGPQGPQGADSTVPGPQGPQGLRGPQGIQGEKGDTGDQGPTGPRGLQGDQGIQGIQGEKGDTGDQGPQGLTGRQGPQGTDGESARTIYNNFHGTNLSEEDFLTELRGDTGAQGIQGIQGEKGDTGDQGIQGIQGEKGDTGDEGPRGPQGLQGDAGAPGLAGRDGIDGDIGPKGDTGEQGPQGERGERGPRGNQGNAGLSAREIYNNFHGTNLTQEDFLTVIRGPQGIDGPEGPEGPHGPVGPKGDTGEQGPAGPQGIRGPEGNEGPVGRGFLQAYRIANGLPETLTDEDILTHVREDYRGRDGAKGDPTNIDTITIDSGTNVDALGNDVNVAAEDVVATRYDISFNTEAVDENGDPILDADGNPTYSPIAGQNQTFTALRGEPGRDVSNITAANPFDTGSNRQTTVSNYDVNYSDGSDPDNLRIAAQNGDDGVSQRYAYIRSVRNLSLTNVNVRRLSDIDATTYAAYNVATNGLYIIPNDESQPIELLSPTIADHDGDGNPETLTLDSTPAQTVDFSGTVHETSGAGTVTITDGSFSIGDHSNIPEEGTIYINNIPFDYEGFDPGSDPALGVYTFSSVTNAGGANFSTGQGVSLTDRLFGVTVLIDPNSATDEPANNRRVVELQWTPVFEVTGTAGPIGPVGLTGPRGIQGYQGVSFKRAYARSGLGPTDLNTPNGIVPTGTFYFYPEDTAQSLSERIDYPTTGGLAWDDDITFGLSDHLYITEAEINYAAAETAEDPDSPGTTRLRIPFTWNRIHLGAGERGLTGPGVYAHASVGANAEITGNFYELGFQSITIGNRSEAEYIYVFDTPLPDTHYTVLANVTRTSHTRVTAHVHDKTTTGFRIRTTNAGITDQAINPNLDGDGRPVLHAHNLTVIAESGNASIVTALLQAYRTERNLPGATLTELIQDVISGEQGMFEVRAYRRSIDPLLSDIDIAQATGDLFYLRDAGPNRPAGFYNTPTIAGGGNWSRTIADAPGTGRLWALRGTVNPLDADPQGRVPITWELTPFRIEGVDGQRDVRAYALGTIGNTPSAITSTINYDISPTTPGVHFSNFTDNSTVWSQTIPTPTTGRPVIYAATGTVDPGMADSNGLVEIDWQTQITQYNALTGASGRNGASEVTAYTRSENNLSASELILTGESDAEHSINLTNFTFGAYTGSINIGGTPTDFLWYQNISEIPEATTGDLYFIRGRVGSSEPDASIGTIVFDDAVNAVSGATGAQGIFDTVVYARSEHDLTDTSLYSFDTGTIGFRYRVGATSPITIFPRLTLADTTLANRVVTFRDTISAANADSPNGRLFAIRVTIDPSLVNQSNDIGENSDSSILNWRNAGINAVDGKEITSFSGPSSVVNPTDNTQTLSTVIANFNDGTTTDLNIISDRGPQGLQGDQARFEIRAYLASTTLDRAGDTISGGPYHFSFNTDGTPDYSSYGVPSSANANAGENWTRDINVAISNRDVLIAGGSTAVLYEVVATIDPSDTRDAQRRVQINWSRVIPLQGLQGPTGAAGRDGTGPQGAMGRQGGFYIWILGRSHAFGDTDTQVRHEAARNDQLLFSINNDNRNLLYRLDNGDFTIPRNSNHNAAAPRTDAIARIVRAEDWPNIANIRNAGGINYNWGAIAWIDPANARPLTAADIADQGDNGVNRQTEDGVTRLGLFTNADLTANAGAPIEVIPADFSNAFLLADPIQLTDIDIGINTQGTDLTIEDDGVESATAAERLNFAGRGVDVTGDGSADKTITIRGISGQNVDGATRTDLFTPQRAITTLGIGANLNYSATTSGSETVLDISSPGLSISGNDGTLVGGSNTTNLRFNGNLVDIDPGSATGTTRIVDISGPLVSGPASEGATPTVLTGGANQFNFTGNGVTVSGTGDTKTINISGGGSATFADIVVGGTAGPSHDDATNGFTVPSLFQDIGGTGGTGYRIKYQPSPTAAEEYYIRVFAPDGQEGIYNTVGGTFDGEPNELILTKDGTY